MKTMRLADGDLRIGPDGGYDMVTGAAKVAQDLRCALLEPMGIDRFHPGWGALLHDYVGLLADEETRFTVQQEVNRVIGNYTAIQRDKIQRDVVSGLASRFSNDEVVQTIRKVSVALKLDTISVTIGLAMVSGSLAIVTGEV